MTGGAGQEGGTAALRGALCAASRHVEHFHMKLSQTEQTCAARRNMMHVNAA
jgi:hypothetical protein